MSDEDSELDRLFGAMAKQALMAEPAAEAVRRRERAIGGMRALQLRLSSDPPRTRLRRYAVWVAAAALLTMAGAALAATTGVWPFARSGVTPDSPAQRPPVIAIPVAVPPPTLAEPAPPPPAPALPVDAAPPRPRAATKAAESAGSGASLEEVNRLFAEAKRARREHRDADALELLQRLLTKYPRSVLGHEASVERFRALARLGRTNEAQRYAKAYLAAYPKGFAADEARRLAGPHEGP